MKIEIIIPNYNGFELVEKNLPQVIHAVKNQKSISITVVDDGSFQEEQENLSKFIDTIKKKNSVPIRLILNKENKGFSSNVNRAALVSDSDVLVLLNTDVSPYDNFLEPLLVHFKDEKIFGVGCLDESIENKTVLRGRGLAEWKRGFLMHRKGEIDKTDTFWVSGGSSAFNTRIFKLLGGFDSLYDPFYWEDIDLSYRAQKAGFNVFFEPKSRVVHIHKKGSIKKHYKDNVIRSYAMRNQFTFIWKNITDSKLLLSHIFWLPYFLLKALFRKDTIIIKGFILALIRFPDIMKHRSVQKKIYILSDSSIIKPI